MKRLLAWLSVLFVTGCATAPVETYTALPFDEAEYSALQMTGSGIVRGQVFATTGRGDVKKGVGTTKSPTRVLEMNLYCQALLEKALLAGGLLPGNTGVADALATPQETKAPTPPALSWLVHNAGTVARYGPRLGGLATAIRHFGFDLHPLSEATNFANAVGDFGSATPWAMLAEAVVRTSDSGAAVLGADFQMNDRLAMSMTMPVPGL